MDTSIFTLFAANAVILLVVALAFFCAWRGQQNETYWGSWAAANLTLAAALVLFMFAPAREDGLAMIFANCLLVAGFGLRWRAARQFGRRPFPLPAILVPTACAISLFAFPAVFGHTSVFTILNLILTGQAIAVAYEFWRDRRDGLPSRYGLVAAYAVMAFSFAMRAGQGLIGDFNSYLPHDAILQAHLVIALFHTTASGAFALSIAYERGAIELRKAALCDPLTGAPNRRAFEMRLEECLTAGPGRAFAVALFDIDRFKSVNDRYGHAAGDAALRACADTILQTVRSTDFVARIGGEEFAAILPDISASGALDLVERIRRATQARPIVGNGNCFGITLSAGIAHSSDGSDLVDELLKRADAELYQAKFRGRNRVSLSAA